MKKVKPTKAWTFSLAISSICSLVIALTSIFNIALPDTVKRIFGITVLVALPVMVYTSVKMLKELEE